MPIFLVCALGLTVSYPVSGRQWARRKIRGSITARNVSAVLTSEDVLGQPVTPNRPLSAWAIRPASSTVILHGGSNKYEFGKGLDTRGANGIYFVELVSARQQGTIIIANLPAAGDNVSIHRRPRSVDSRLVYPLLRGKDVKRWLAVPSGHIIAPYDQGNLGHLLTENELARFPGVLEFFRGFKKPLSERKTPPKRAWKMTDGDWYRLDGPMEHMHGPYKIVVRELQHGPSAALVVDLFSDNLGRTATVLVDHKLCFCSLQDEDEALYLIGMINSSPIQELIKAFGNAIAISPQTLARLPIPKFDRELHSDIAQAVRKIIKIAAEGGIVVEAEREADLMATQILARSAATDSPAKIS